MYNFWENVLPNFLANSNPVMPEKGFRDIFLTSYERPTFIIRPRLVLIEFHSFLSVLRVINPIGKNCVLFLWEIAHILFFLSYSNSRYLHRLFELRFFTYFLFSSMSDIIHLMFLNFFFILYCISVFLSDSWFELPSQFYLQRLHKMY